MARFYRPLAVLAFLTLGTHASAVEPVKPVASIRIQKEGKRTATASGSRSRPPADSSQSDTQPPVQRTPASTCSRWRPKSLLFPW